jgi:hypothetical protein
MTFQGVSFHGLVWSAQPSFDIILKVVTANVIKLSASVRSAAESSCARIVCLRLETQPVEM